MSYLENGMYVCTCVLRGGLYVYVYVHPTWWLCVCVHTHTYIPFRYDPQVGHTHNAYPAPGRMDTHTQAIAVETSNKRFFTAIYPRLQTAAIVIQPL